MFRFGHGCCRSRLVLRAVGLVYLVGVFTLTTVVFGPSRPTVSPPKMSALTEDDAKLCQLVSPGPAGYSMHDLLLTWPSDKPKGFIYLTVNPEQLDEVIPLLQSVYTNFNRRFDYPFVVFSEDPGSASSLRRFIANLGDGAQWLGKVFVYDISGFWQPPPYIMMLHDNDTSRLIDYSYRSIRESGCSYPGGLGYWLMCRFQSKGLTEIPFVQSFEYLWRLDIDASLCGELSFDIFAYMKANDYWQGYLAEDTWDSCAQRLTEHIHSFVEKYGVVPVQGPETIKDARTWYIYNNFEVFKVQFYLSQEYLLFIDFIDRTGGFFYFRWGDAPVRTQASRLFMPKNKMREFKVGEVFYTHQSFMRCKADT